MPKTKYDELKEANDHNRELFEKYEKECWQFIQQFWKELIDYLECPEERVEWRQFSEKETKEERQAKGVIELVRGRRMALQSDAFYQFTIRIMLDSFNSMWLDLALRVKKIDDCFVVKGGEGQPEIFKGKQEKLSELIESIFHLMKGYLETQFDDFTREKPRKPLGFKISRNQQEPLVAQSILKESSI